MMRGAGGHEGAHVALGEVEHTSRVLADLRRRMEDQHRRLEQAERDCEMRRMELVRASQARETLERLSERREAEHLRAETAREQRELNEAAINRHRAGGGTDLTASLAQDLDSVA